MNCVLNFHGFHWSHMPRFIRDGVDQEALEVSGFRCYWQQKELSLLFDKTPMALKHTVQTMVSNGFRESFFCLPFLMQRRLLRFGLYSEFQPSPLPFSPKTTGLRNELKSKQHTISGLLKLVERLSQQADETSAQETAEAQGCGWVCCRTSLFCVPLFSCFLLKSGIDFEPF